MAETLTIYEIFSVKVLCDLEKLVRNCSRSLKLAPFDRSHMTFYWFAIVRIALLVPFLSYSILNNIVTMKPGLEVTQGH